MASWRAEGKEEGEEGMELSSMSPLQTGRKVCLVSSLHTHRESGSLG